MRCLARLMRLAMVSSGTRNAVAISAVVRPPTARRVSGIAELGVSTGWQQRNSSASESSSLDDSAAGVSSRAAARSSRSRRAWSVRTMSISRREATAINQPRGL